MSPAISPTVAFVKIVTAGVWMFGLEVTVLTCISIFEVDVAPLAMVSEDVVSVALADVADDVVSTAIGVAVEDVVP